MLGQVTTPLVHMAMLPTLQVLLAFSISHPAGAMLESYQQKITLNPRYSETCLAIYSGTATRLTQ